MSKSITLKTEEIQDVEMVDEDDCSTSVFLSAQRETVNDKESTPPSTTKAKSETPAPSPTKQTKAGPQLIGHLPRAEEAALKVFERLDANHYQYSTLGRSREVMESMTCDCQYVPDEDDLYVACGDGSDCINRLTQVECLEDDCRCRSACQNQRMQRKQYAQIEIVLTEKKGFGLRAGVDIKKDAFIYEYIGDVVSQPTFAKRMREYAEEGIRHFYFMMLQKDEFIDATKRGGIGRFANHSCNPNCYVAKWTVGHHVRMGIYAKRNIKRDEELTFNYNVDRYGHDAQPCYCGEPNCVGLLGGKTQTEVAAMDDLYLDALGISEEVEMYGLKGTKKKKSKKLDEDYTPVLKPLLLTDVPKVIQAIRQTQSRKVLLKLLTRMKITENDSALRQLMRLRGFSVMGNILNDFAGDIEICVNVIECMARWPLLQRNKVEDSQIEEPVKELLKSSDENLRALAEKVLAQWATLEVGYRIPKRQKQEGEEVSLMGRDVYGIDDESRIDSKNKRTRLMEEIDLDATFRGVKPLGRSSYQLTPSRDYHDRSRNLDRPTPRHRDSDPDGLNLLFANTETDIDPRLALPTAPSREDIAGVIAAAARAAEEAKKLEEERKAAEAAEIAMKAEKLAARAKKKELSTEEKEALKEKKLLKLIGAVVVKTMSKYQKQMDHEAFKKYAKELTAIIAEKEKKSSSYTSGKLESLSEEKINKIKKFAKEYIMKLMRRLEKSRSNQPNGKTRDPRVSTSTPDPEINLEETLELALDDDQDGDDETGDPSPATDTNEHEPVVSVVVREGYMESPTPGFIIPTNSPVLVKPVKPKRSRWDQLPNSVPLHANARSLYADL